MGKSKSQPGKLYYTIGEVAEMFNESTSLIRFWEKEFDIIRPQKNKKGNRLFTRKDVDHFHLIYHLVKEKGYTLKGARQKLKEDKPNTDAEFEAVKTLKNIKAFLRDIRKELEE
ncbi:MAG: MerR family transcriptional regulator [Bacteroidales bacterium]